MQHFAGLYIPQADFVIVLTDHGLAQVRRQGILTGAEFFTWPLERGHLVAAGRLPDSEAKARAGETLAVRREKQ